MSDAVTVKTRKFIRNSLLGRRQMVVDVFHPGKPPVSKADLRESLAAMHKVTEKRCIVLFGFKTKFGGGKSTGFSLIYDNVEEMKKFEPKHRLVQLDLLDASKVSSRTRKAYKELKGRKKRTWGTGRRAQLHKQKKAEA
mmetsp:Transcript_23305/g.81228  ORF Transcript_23305/g.81228 Transcript_23305/m.81228 type:complete len:139 (-) Transcript_23305:69-485(-)|eukprot:CAMPEP_0203811028 /NCGR_PEP_ID=MMETSP0115-20131106/3296_1 /ASSEMBLY_ACC=CAM_ASM_000227 /TAXON_ID=33651 /ORGANISM="Bicosoecid sp, Strain ms1" /LENGTH=138 /DNA_ID=CAMNT_0050719835 /DNA_START=56 /DNA_END=472 /DNA_ORIENTATION=+